MKKTITLPTWVAVVLVALGFAITFDLSSRDANAQTPKEFKVMDLRNVKEFGNAGTDAREYEKLINEMAAKGWGFDHSAGAWVVLSRQLR